MSREITSKADELQFGFGANAIEEGVLRAEDYILREMPAQAQDWVSVAFEIKRRERSTSKRP